MQASNIPTKIPLPFAYNATSSYKRSIPAASQIGITAGAASLNDGFPPVTFSPTGSGGVPPFGQDMNGILYEITSLQQWQQGGGFFPFDSAFATTVGGYPNGAVVQSSSFNGFWLSTADNNSNNPDTGGANWIPLLFKGVTSVSTTGGTTTLSNLQAAYPIIIVTGTLTSNSIIVLPTFAQQWVVFNNTSGAYTLTVKTSAGTGVSVPQGSSQHMFGDGTNINQAIPYYALLNSPVFTGTPQAPTAATSDNSNTLATTAFVKTSGAGNLNQSWQNVTASRAVNTNYTNTESCPIAISVIAVGGNFMGVSINMQGVVVSTSNSGSGGYPTSVFAIIPAGVVYSVGGSIGQWNELR